MAKKFYKYNEREGRVHILKNSEISVNEAISMLNEVKPGAIRDRESVIKFVAAASVITGKELIAEDLDKGLIRAKYFRINRNGEKVSTEYESIRRNVKNKLKKMDTKLKPFYIYNDNQVRQFWVNECNKYGFTYAGHTYKKNKSGDEERGLTHSYLWIKTEKGERKVSYYSYMNFKNGLTEMKWLKNQIRLTDVPVETGISNSMYKYTFKERVSEALSKVRKFFN